MIDGTNDYSTNTNADPSAEVAELQAAATNVETAVANGSVNPYAGLSNSQDLFNSNPP